MSSNGAGKCADFFHKLVQLKKGYVVNGGTICHFETIGILREANEGKFPFRPALRLEILDSFGLCIKVECILPSNQTHW